MEKISPPVEVNLDEAFYVCNDIPPPGLANLLVGITDTERRRLTAEKLGCPFQLSNPRPSQEYRITHHLDSICVKPYKSDGVQFCTSEIHTYIVERNGKTKIVFQTSLDMDYD